MNVKRVTGTLSSSATSSHYFLRTRFLEEHALQTPDLVQENQCIWRGKRFDHDEFVVVVTTSHRRNCR